MARRPRSSRLETRTARLKLPVRKKPHDFTTIAPGIALAYRRNQGAGTWVVRVADGHGGNWTKGFVVADDYENADGSSILSVMPPIKDPSPVFAVRRHLDGSWGLRLPYR